MGVVGQGNVKEERGYDGGELAFSGGVASNEDATAPISGEG